MTYHFLDAVSGSDSNGGTSKVDAKLTPASLAGAVLAASDRVYIRGRVIQPTDAPLTAIRVPSGVKGAPTMICGYDPEYPAEWWCAGCMVDGAGTLTGTAWQHVSGDTWKVQINTSWAGGWWCHYWDGQQGRGHEPWMFTPVNSAAEVLATANSWWQDGTSTPWVHVNVAGTGAASVSGKILHGRRGWSLQGQASGTSFFYDKAYFLGAGFSYFLCNDRMWDPLSSGRTNATHIEWYGGGRHILARANNIEKNPVNPYGRNRFIVLSDGIIEGGSAGLIYPKNQLIAGYNQVSGHQLSDSILSGLTLVDAGYTVPGDPDAHALGFQASGARIKYTGGKILRCGRPIVVWRTGNGNTGAGGPGLEFRHTLIEEIHNSGAKGAQSGTASAGTISTQSGSKFIQVAPGTGLAVGAGWTVTIANSSPSETTVGGITITGGLTVSSTDPDGTIWLLSGTAASSTASSTQAHGVSVAARGIAMSSAVSYENTESAAADWSDNLILGILARGPIVRRPPAYGLTPLSAARAGYSPDNDFGLRNGSISTTPPLFRHCVIDGLPIGIVVPTGTALNADMRACTVRGPYADGATHFGFARITNSTGGTRVVEDCDFIVGTGSARYEVDSNVYTDLASAQAATPYFDGCSESA